MTVAECKTEKVLAQSLQRDLKHTSSKLAKKRKSLNDYHKKQATAPKAPPKPKAPLSTKIHVASDSEKKIITWAKENYKSIDDIQIGAKELAIKAGEVYTVLKHHSFIKQNETTEYRVLDSYFKNHGNLQKIVDDTGLGVWIVAKTVENLGYSPRWHEFRQSRYITKSQHLGIGAEKKFKELVPQAVDVNEDFRECNPYYDFVVNHKTVDVKDLAPTKRKAQKNHNTYWFWRLPKNEQADFYCLFLCHDKDKRIDGDFTILLIPKEVLPQATQTSISTSAENESYKFWFQFEVDACALPYMLGCE